VKSALGSGGSLLPLLQQVQRCFKQLHKQQPDPAAVPPAAAGSGSQLQNDVLGLCLEFSSVPDEAKAQFWLSHAVADAGVQVLAALCCTWQQQLTDLGEQQKRHSSSQQQQQQQQASTQGQQRRHQQRQLQRSLLAKWKQPLQLSPDQIAAAAGNVHQLVLQQQLGPAASALQQASLELPKLADGASSLAAEVAFTAVTALREHLNHAWGKVPTATTPAAMQLTLQVVMLLSSIWRLQQQQQQQSSDSEQPQKEEEQQQSVEQQLLSDLWELLRMQQFTGLQACKTDPAELAAWPWGTYLQSELLVLQAAMAGSPPGHLPAKEVATAVIHELWNETPGGRLSHGVWMHVVNQLLPILQLRVGGTQHAEHCWTESSL
jgi:hypothetical protein